VSNTEVILEIVENHKDSLSGNKNDLVANTIASELRKKTVNDTKAAVQQVLNSSIVTRREGDSFFEDDLDEDDAQVFNHGHNDNYDDENSQDFSVSAADPATQKILKEIEEKEKRDIFIDQGEKWMALGQIVRYDISKNNRLLVKKDHPFSWEEIQASYGKGHYKVNARLKETGRYLTSQTKLIDDSPAEMTGRNLTGSKEVQTTNNDKSLSNADLILMLEEKNKQLENQRRESEARVEEKLLKYKEELRLEAKEKMEREERFLEKYSARAEVAPKPVDLVEQLTKLAPVITVLAPFFKKEKDNSMVELIKTMNENNQKAIERSEANTKELLATITKALEGANKKSTGDFDALKVMEMIKKAEDDGFQKWRDLDELAEEKAAARAEARGDSDSDSPKEKDSLSEILLKGLLPALPAIMAGRQGGVAPQIPAPQVMAPAPRQIVARPTVIPPVRPNPVQQRGSVSQTHVQNPARNTGIKNQATEARISQTNNQETQKGMGNTQPNNTGTNVVPAKKSFLNSTTDEAEMSQASLTPPENNASPIIASVETSTRFEGDEKDPANLKRITDIVFPIAVNEFSNPDASLDNTSNKIIDELVLSGIDLTTVLRDFDDESLNVILMELPNDFHELVKGLHNEIITKILARN